jgi:glycosyltransferase involved in cell wall biosynthesis
LYGGDWPGEFRSKGSINQRDIIGIYHDSVCNLSISHYNDLDHYFSDRLLMCMAAGRPVIAYRFPKWESYFTNNCDLVIVNSIDEIAEKVRWLKENPDIADYIGAQGANKVRAEHTYYTMIKKLISMVGVK